MWNLNKAQAILVEVGYDGIFQHESTWNVVIAWTDDVLYEGKPVQRPIPIQNNGYVIHADSRIIEHASKILYEPKVKF